MTGSAFAEIEAGADLAAALNLALADCESEEERENLLEEELDKWMRRGVIGIDTAAALTSVFLSA